MFLLARIRVVLARHPLVYWALVAMFAGIVVIALGSAFGSADDARRSWGTSAPAWVATAPAAPGQAIAAERRDVPLAMLPVDAVTAAPAGNIALQRVGVGEIVTTADVGDHVLALAPEGWQLVAIVTDPATLPAEPGDHVAVYAAGVAVADDAVMVRVDEASVVIAVPAAAVAAVTEVALDQRAVLTWRRP